MCGVHGRVNHVLGSLLYCYVVIVVVDVVVMHTLLLLLSSATLLVSFSPLLPLCVVPLQRSYQLVSGIQQRDERV